jgi:hypothetical protein
MKDQYFRTVEKLLFCFLLLDLWLFDISGLNPTGSSKGFLIIKSSVCFFLLLLFNNFSIFSKKLDQTFVNIRNSNLRSVSFSHSNIKHFFNLPSNPRTRIDDRIRRITTKNNKRMRVT